MRQLEQLSLSAVFPSVEQDADEDGNEFGKRDAEPYAVDSEYFWEQQHAGGNEDQAAAAGDQGGVYRIAQGGLISRVHDIKAVEQLPSA